MSVKKVFNKSAEDLLKVVLNIDSLSLAKKLFRDLFTDQEIEELSNRWKVANLLWEQKSYSYIEEVTGMSSTTIARISKALNEGAGGYRYFLKKKDEEKELVKKEF